jgi:hypothetical protein
VYSSQWSLGESADPENPQLYMCKKLHDCRVWGLLKKQGDNNNAETGIIISC